MKWLIPSSTNQSRKGWHSTRTVGYVVCKDDTSGAGKLTVNQGFEMVVIFVFLGVEEDDIVVPAQGSDYINCIACMLL
jgi:hypothetical protein